jgi:hypothetical protein
MIALCVLVGSPLSPLRGADDRGAYRVRFGTVEKDKAGHPSLAAETTRLPLKFRDTGFRFGYEIVPPDQGSYTYQYVVHTPAPPATITGGLADSNSGPPTTTVTSETKTSSGGTTVDYLWFDPGDPVGDWSIDIFTNGKLQRTIKFTVSSP